ncbi:MAG: hypothetical protein ACI91G_000262 [Gammaproteobacteria bacterium]|jgi:hypothetical protein
MQKFLNTITTKLPGWLGALLIGAPFFIGVVGESMLADMAPVVEPATESRTVERLRASDVEWAEGFRQQYAANSLYQ